MVEGQFGKEVNAYLENFTNFLLWQDENVASWVIENMDDELIQEIETT